MAVGLKQYPCFALGQGPISAAMELRKRLPAQAEIASSRSRSPTPVPPACGSPIRSGRVPSSQEAADHSVYFLVAVALLDGRFGLDQLTGGRWQDADVRALIERTEATIDPCSQASDISALPARGYDDERRDHRDRAVVTPGMPAMPLSWDEVTEKFRRCAAGVIARTRRARSSMRLRGSRRCLRCARCLERWCLTDETARAYNRLCELK